MVFSSEMTVKGLCEVCVRAGEAWSLLALRRKMRKLAKDAKVCEKCKTCFIAKEGRAVAKNLFALTFGRVPAHFAGRANILASM